VAKIIIIWLIVWLISIRVASAFLFNILVSEACDAGTIYAKWDSAVGSEFVGSAAGSCVVTQLPDGVHCFSTDMYRNTDNDGAAMIYLPLGSDAIPAGTSAGNVTPFVIECDYRFRSGDSVNCTFFGLFNSDGDNDKSPAVNAVGAQLGGSDIRGIARNSGGYNISTDVIRGDGKDGLHRIRVKVYNSYDGTTKMNVILYRIDDTTFEKSKVGEISGVVILDSGQVFQKGMDVIGIRNIWYVTSGTPHAVYDFDNFYFSTTEFVNKYHPVPSFAPLCVSAVLETTPGDFDPWNTSRWANWYSNDKLVKPFTIDCNVKLATRGGWSSPWTPDMSALPAIGYYAPTVFFMGNCSRGVTFNGASQLIDIRNSTQGEMRCFYVYGSQTEGVPKTSIKYLGMKGFRNGILVRYRTHPLEIYHVHARENINGIYLGGEKTTVDGGTIRKSAKSGMYVDGDNNVIQNVEFLDNYTEGNVPGYPYVRWFGDVMVDTGMANIFSNNMHITTDSSRYDAAYKLYRNKGEDGWVRENPPNGNLFIDNTVSNYDIAFEVGAREGGRPISYGNDLADEGRDYAMNNVFRNNNIINSEFGVKINCSGNTVDGNWFSGVTYPVLLHCVWYSLADVHIADQAGDRVAYWFANSEWNGVADYADWFRLQEDRNYGANPISERYVHVSHTNGTPDFDDYTGSATLLINDSQVVDSTMNDVYRGAGTPIDVAVGDFWEAGSGDELAVIYDEPISAVDGTNYYTIVIYDSDGREINRCGKSETKWLAITAGNFIGSDVDRYTGDEIAAVHAIPVDGKYPIYIFGRGNKNPFITLLTNNTTRITALTAGNFNKVTDSYDEIAYVHSTSLSTIRFCKPTDALWSNETTGAVNVYDLASGEFDGDTTNGDEIAAFQLGHSRAFLYKAGDSDHYSSIGPTSGSAVAAIAAGDLDGNPGDDEVVLVYDNYEVNRFVLYCYKPILTTPGMLTPFKDISVNVTGRLATSLGCGKPFVGESLGSYEAIRGSWSSGNYSEEVESWGDSVVYIPSEPKTFGCGIPAFWVSSNPDDDSERYIKVTPLLR
jgi:hypothetical protein